MIHNLNRAPIGNMHSGIRSLIRPRMFYLSRSALDEIADDGDAPRIAGLNLPSSISVLDPVVSQLGTTLLPAFERPKKPAAFSLIKRPAAMSRSDTAVCTPQPIPSEAALLPSSSVGPRRF